MRHDWPGNVRELRNVVAVAHALADEGEEIDVAAHLGALTETPAAAPRASAAAAAAAASRGRQFQDAKRDVLARFERDYFAALYDEARAT